MKNQSQRRSLWPLGITVALVVFALGLAGLIVAAVRSNSDLVTEDYYEQELRYQQQLDRSARAALFTGEITARYEPRLGLLLLQLPAKHAELAAAGEVHLYRPSAAGMDRRVPLALNAAGMQVLPAADLARGLWRVKITWQVEEQGYYWEAEVEIPSKEP